LTKAVILAGGEGTRLRPLTFTHPKPMVPIGKEPVIHYLLTRLSTEGFSDVVMVVGYLRNQIMSFVGDGSRWGLRVNYAVESNEAHYGTAGSLKLAEHLLDETFLVTQADTITNMHLADAVRFHTKSGSYATIVMTRVQDPWNFGVAVLDEDQKIIEFQEKPRKEEAKSDLVSTGFYVLEPEVLDHILAENWDFAKNLFPHLLDLQKRISGYPTDDFWVDVGNLDGYLKGMKWVLNAEGDLSPKERRNIDSAHLQESDEAGTTSASQRLVEQGAVIEEGVRINQSVVKKDARICMNSSLNDCMVMERSYIGRNCIISDSVIGQAAVVNDESVVHGSIIGPGGVIGSKVRLNQGARIWPNVHVPDGDTVSGIMAVPMEKAFYFYTGIGQYTGLIATSVNGFIEALEVAPIQSLEFHAKKRDFERWVREVIGSSELADAVEGIRRRALVGEELRSALVDAVKRWAHKVSHSTGPHV
jgi:NDP-sugar pyrophosphorylase family protein